RRSGSGSPEGSKPLTEGEALQLVGLIRLLWRGQDISRDTARLWWQAGLQGVEFRHVVAGVKALATSTPFAPQLSEILEAAGDAARIEREERRPAQVVEGPGVPPPPELSAAVKAALHERNPDKGPLARV